MVERGEEELVRRVEQREQEALDGGPRIRDSLPEHAVADVQQHAQPHGDALVGEGGDRLLDAILPDRKGFPWQPRRQVPFGVDDGRGDHHEIDAGLEQPRVAEDLGRRAPDGGQSDHSGHERSRQHHAPILSRLSACPLRPSSFRNRQPACNSVTGAGQNP